MRISKPIKRDFYVWFHEKLKVKFPVKRIKSGENSLLDSDEQVLKEAVHEIKIAVVKKDSHSMVCENPQGLAKKIAAVIEK